MNFINNVKSLSDMTSKYLCEPDFSKTAICEYVLGPNGEVKLPDPVLASNYKCIFCGSKDFYWPPLRVGQPDKILVCHNRNCSSHESVKGCVGIETFTITGRAVEWPVFCEINDIGDVHHNVKFENVEQDKGKIDFLLKFAKKPHSVIWMQGKSGTGKTYASMGVCELFTRYKTSAMFMTQKQLTANWLQTFKDDVLNNFIRKIETINLLVVDDFGTGDLTNAFMTFFLDLINTRMQWTDRGTIISSNLQDDKFKEKCGEALFDRITTGQKMVFTNEGGSRRRKIL